MLERERERMKKRINLLLIHRRIGEKNNIVGVNNLYRVIRSIVVRQRKWIRCVPSVTKNISLATILMDFFHNNLHEGEKRYRKRQKKKRKRGTFIDDVIRIECSIN